MSDKPGKCPFCGGGTNELHPNQHWTGMRYHINSVTLIHWCDGIGGMRRSRIEITAKTVEEAIAAWNRRDDDELIRRLGQALRIANDRNVGGYFDEADEGAVILALSALYAWEKENGNL